MSKTTIAREADLKVALSAYLHGEDIALRRALLPDFIYKFGIFMMRDYERHYSLTTALECLATLRKYLRMAIAEGRLPNLDATPMVAERLEAETCGRVKQRETRRDTSLGVAACEQLGRLARCIDVTLAKSRSGEGFQSERDCRAAALSARNAAIYLFGALNFGLEIRESLDLRYDKSKPDSIYLPKYGLEMPLSDSAKKLVELANGGERDGDHLFSVMDNAKYGDDLDKASAIVERRVVKFISNEGLALYRQRSVMIDWLNLALENGLPGDQAAALVNHWADMAVGADVLADAVLAAQRRSSGGAPATCLVENWHLLRVISPGVKRDRYVGMLESSGILGCLSETRKRLYAPKEWQCDKERGEMAVMSRYVFFRATPMQTEMVNRFTPYARVLRQSVNGEFIKVKESEIRQLQEMLHDFPDAVELTDREAWLRRHNASIVVGSKALIRSGRLIGREATIVEIKGKEKSHPTYLLEYAQGALVFRTSLSGIDLELVPTLPQS